MLVPAWRFGIHERDIGDRNLAQSEPTENDAHIGPVEHIADMANKPNREHRDHSGDCDRDNRFIHASAIVPEIDPNINQAACGGIDTVAEA